MKVIGRFVFVPDHHRTQSGMVILVVLVHHYMIVDTKVIKVIFIHIICFYTDYTYK